MRGWLLGVLLLVIAVCSAILLVDRFVVQPRRVPSPPATERLAAEFGFDAVPAAEREMHARRLLAGLGPLAQIEEISVAAMVRREHPAGTVWAFELAAIEDAPVARPGATPAMELEVEVLQPVIVVERGSRAGSALPFWFGLRQGSPRSKGASPWIELLGDQLDSSNPMVAHWDGLSFVAMSAHPEEVQAGIARPAVERMAAWPDVLFLGVQDRVVFLWPPPRASLAYWAARSTNLEMVPSLASPGFEWDLQRAVDIANLLAPQQEALPRVVELEIEIPPLQLPELDLDQRLEEIRQETHQRTEEIMQDFDRDLEEFRQRNARQRELFQQRLRQRLDAASEGAPPATGPEEAEPPPPDSLRP